MSTVDPKVQAAMKEASAKKNELITQEQSAPSQSIATFLPAIDKHADNFDGTPLNRLRLHSLSASPDCKPIQACIGTEINLVYYAISMYEATDETTGEIVDRLRIVMIDDNEQAYVTGSPYVLRELGAIVSYIGNKKFSPPIRIKFVSKKGKHPSPFLTIQVTV